MKLLLSTALIAEAFDWSLIEKGGALLIVAFVVFRLLNEHSELKQIRRRLDQLVTKEDSDVDA